MRGHDDVKRAVDRLYDTLGKDLEGLDGSTLIDDVLAEKDQTIAELRAALRAKTEVVERLESFNRRLRKTLPVRVLRKMGAIKMIKRSVLKVDASR